VPEPASAWKRFWSRFNGGLDGIDILLYGGLGVALLGYLLFFLGSAIYESGNWPALTAYVAIVAGSVATLARDVRGRQFTWPSKLLIGAWGICVALIVVIEFVESFS